MAAMELTPEASAQFWGVIATGTKVLATIRVDQLLEDRLEGWWMTITLDGDTGMIDDFFYA